MIAVLWSLAAAGAHAQAGSGLFIPGANVQKRANAVLSLMAYSAVPDLASSSLSIDNATSGDPGVTMTQLGGGATLSKSVPLYLEGAIAYSRYDPTFVASNGSESRNIPTRWNTVTGTGGIGWDFPLLANRELVIRPIFNFTLGHVASDLAVGKAIAEHVTDQQISFLDNGTLNAYGLGGSVMLDLEHYRDNYEIDVELRYTNIHLQSFGGSSDAVKGMASAQTASLWARWRAPTGLRALDRPLRYVLELSHSQYLGSQAGILGFNRLTTLGTGLELDTSAHEVFVTRVRAVLRYVFGNNVSGASLGLAASF
ncbi:autotransporter domain-containing protein [Cupriavidus taiwanensis]|uniref:autotransporter domain-containing protein n=1 Tax=Cupriavidus taiwanensis TaxID=164546 RepID=UPI000E2F59A1|nr:autotransporter domain-containing protein [Cupriavidus taiwanensis]